MDRMKTFLKYALWVIGFFILSEMLITVGLNSAYKNIEEKNDSKISDNRISIYQSEATSVNGRIRGTVTNSGEEDLSNKFLRIDFYSKRDVFLGSKYVELGDMKKDESKNFEAFFKLKDVSYYKTKFVDSKDANEIELIPKDFKIPDVWWLIFLAKLMFW